MRRTDGARGLPLHTRTIILSCHHRRRSRRRRRRRRSLSARVHPARYPFIVVVVIIIRRIVSVFYFFFFSPAAPSVLLQHRLCVHCACSCHRARHARPAISFRPTFLLPLFGDDGGGYAPSDHPPPPHRSKTAPHRKASRLQAHTVARNVSRVYNKYNNI